MSMDDEEYNSLGDSVVHTETLEEAMARPSEYAMDESDAPPTSYPALSAQQMSKGKVEFMRVYVPPQRITPLRNAWMDIYTPIAEHMKLQIRFNTFTKHIELQTCSETESPQALTKAADYCRAFCLGFELRDAIALLRLDDLYIDSFHVREVKSVITEEELSRAIGRVAGHNGKTKYTIENATKTRIVLADGMLHILGYVYYAAFTPLLS